MPNEHDRTIAGALCRATEARSTATAAITVAKQFSEAAQRLKESAARAEQDAADALRFARGLAEVALGRAAVLREVLGSAAAEAVGALPPDQLAAAKGFTVSPVVKKYLAQVPAKVAFYRTGHVRVRELMRVNPDTLVLRFQVPVETQQYCAGVDLQLDEGRATIRFIRAVLGETPQVKLRAPLLSPKTMIQQVKLPIASGMPVFLADTSGGAVALTDEQGNPPSPATDGATSAADGQPAAVEGVAPVTGTTTTSVPAGHASGTTACPFILCIQSNCAESDGAGFIDGHAWISLHDGQGTLLHTYGLWPDDHPNIAGAGLANGDGSDVRTDYPGDARQPTSYAYCVCLTAEQKAKLDEAIARNVGWSYSNTCAAFAAETFEEVTGVDVDADDNLGFETPRELGDSIKAANGGSPTPTAPPGPPPAPPSSTSTP